MFKITKILVLLLALSALLGAKEYILNTHKYKGIEVYKGSRVVSIDNKYFIEGWTKKNLLKQSICLIVIE